jgi:hypothetical protein
MAPNLTTRKTWVCAIAACTLVGAAMMAAQFQMLIRWRAWTGPLAVGFLFGGYLSLIALAAAWTALGLRRPTSRIAQSLLLCTFAVSAAVANMVLPTALWPTARFVPREELLWPAALFTTVALVQWFLIAAALVGIRTARNIGLRHVANIPPGFAKSDQQLGIRDLLLATAGVGVLLGAVRLIVESDALNSGNAVTSAAGSFGFVALCNVLLMLPLLVAPLFRRFALLSTAIALVFAICVTLGQSMTYVDAMNPAHPTQVAIWRQVIWATNSVQVVVVLVVLGILRAGGYRLAPLNDSRAKERETSSGT